MHCKSFECLSPSRVYSVSKRTQSKVQISVILKIVESGLSLGAPLRCLSTGFRVLKGTASLFLALLFDVSSQDRHPSRCFTARMNIPPCVFSSFKCCQLLYCCRSKPRVVQSQTWCFPPCAFCSLRFRNTVWSILSLC